MREFNIIWLHSDKLVLNELDLMCSNPQDSPCFHFVNYSLRQCCLHFEPLGWSSQTSILLLKFFYQQMYSYLTYKILKVKQVDLAWSGPQGSRKLRFPDFMTTAQDNGEVVSLTHQPPFPPGNTLGTHFYQRLSRPQGHSATGRIMTLKKFQ